MSLRETCVTCGTALSLHVGLQKEPNQKLQTDAQRGQKQWQRKYSLTVVGTRGPASGRKRGLGLREISRQSSWGQRSWTLLFADQTQPGKASCLCQRVEAWEEAGLGWPPPCDLGLGWKMGTGSRDSGDPAGVPLQRSLTVQVTIRAPAGAGSHWPLV